jgi:hypothetical protein
LNVDFYSSKIMTLKKVGFLQVRRRRCHRWPPIRWFAWNRTAQAQASIELATMIDAAAVAVFVEFTLVADV